MTREKKAIILLWSAFFVGFFLGYRTRYLLMIVSGATAWLLRSDLANPKSRWNARSMLIIVLGLCASLLTVRSLTKVWRYESGQTPYWDVGQYIQATHNFASSGVPTITFEGFERDYFTIHRSLSAHFLSVLYRWFDSPWVLWLWQGFWFLAICAVIVGWVRVSTREWPAKHRAILLTLCPFLYLFSPTVSGQFYWAYGFHIFGVFLLAIGLLFFARAQWWLWAVSMSLAVFEQEVFALVVGPFAVAAALKSIRRTGSVLDRPVAWSVLVAAVSLFSLVDFISDAKSLNQVTHYFSTWGQTYPEMARSLARSPASVGIHLLNPLFLKMLLYFAFLTHCLFRPTLRSLVFFVPTLPFLIILALGHDNWLVNIRHHYALPVLVFSLAALILGWLPEQKNTRKAVETVAIIFFVSTLFVVPNPIRASYAALDVYRDRRDDLATIDKIQDHFEWAVCCDGEWCGSFAERRYLLPMEECTNRGPLFEKAKRDSPLVVSATVEAATGRVVMNEINTR